MLTTLRIDDVRRQMAVPAASAVAAAKTSPRLPRWVPLLLSLLAWIPLPWLISFHDRSAPGQAVALTPDQDAVLRWLSRHPDPAAYVASEDSWINDLTPAYTSMRTWRGQDFNTPQAKLRQQEVDAAFAEGILLAANGPVYYVPRRQANWLPPPGARQLYYNGSYVIWRFDPSEMTEDVPLQVDMAHSGTVSVK